MKLWTKSFVWLATQGVIRGVEAVAGMWASSFESLCLCFVYHQDIMSREEPFDILYTGSIQYA